MTESPFALTATQQAFYDQTIPFGYNQWSGLTVKHIEPGFARIAFMPRPEMLTPWGTLNGGVLNSLVEVPAFLALLPSLEEGELPVTNDIFLQHVRPCQATWSTS